MIKRIISAVLAAVLLCGCFVSLTGCKNDSGNFPVTVAGVTIEKRPQKVICLSSEYTEILVNLGYGKLLVGRPYDCSNADIQAVTSVGTAVSPAIDIILSLDADLIITDTTTSPELVSQMSAGGAQVLQLIPPTTRTAFSNLYRCLGSAVDGATDGYNTGDTAARNILIRMDDVERAVSGEDSLNVVIFTNANLSKGITGDSLGSLAIELAGGFNLAIEATNGNVVFDVIAKSDPDVILCPEGCEGTVRSMRELQKCTAVNQNRVYVYDAAKLDSLGIDLVYATWEIARLVHPGLISADMLPEGAVDFLPTTDHFVMNEEEYEEYVAQHEAENNEGENEGYSQEDLWADAGEENN